MPKEITHFTLAQQVISNLPETSKFFQPIQTFPLLSLLGAVCPDSAFYYLAGPQKKQMQALARPFHCPGKNALMPVLKFLNHHRTPKALAFAAGIVCHIIADTTFHPLVYYYAGMKGLHANASTRHKYFETAMDVHFQYLFSGPTRLNNIIRQAKISKQELYQLMTGLYSPQCPRTSLTKYILAWHVTIHTLLGAPAIRRGTAIMTRTAHPVPESVVALMYPFGTPCFLPFFSGRLKYRHPCFGTFHDTNLLTLIRRTVNETIVLLGIIDREMGECKNKQNTKALEARILAAPDLPKICPDLPVETFDAWYGQQDIKPLLYQGVSMPF